ncbi:cation transporter [Catenulispora sp. MAP5-51]|uniref:cation transporter n=1 Tax=Catenulispora sp. MAP5-51 TaxID=3156298 RepID=UPI003519449A
MWDTAWLPGADRFALGWAAVTAALPERTSEVGRAVVACALSVAWAGLAGAVSVVAGLASGALALVAFGLDSVIDGSASAVLVWRLRTELRHPSSAARAARVERVAAKAVGAAMVAAAAYVGVQAIRVLAAGSAARAEPVALILLAASVVVLPGLGVFKLRLARELESVALRGDGVLSVAGAALALVALAGAGAQSRWGWWWSNPVAALVIACFLVREGVKTMRG